MYIATIDGGTSNTRAFVWHDGVIAGQAKAAVGVRNTAMDGTNQRLQEAVRDTLSEAASMAGITTEDISLILAAGMLTSNVGLCDIPHVTAPVRLEELARYGGKIFLLYAGSLYGSFRAYATVIRQRLHRTRALIWI